MKRVLILLIFNFTLLNLYAQDASNWLTVNLDYPVSDKKPSEIINVVVLYSNVLW